MDSDILADWQLQFSNHVWCKHDIPETWHLAKVACLFKKGDASCPENYRPISLLPIGYKLFSSMILNRLKNAGIDEKLWHTQFGFRKGCSTQDAIFITRRMIEQCHNGKAHSIILLALDWAKAFDAIDPSSLVHALKRFGLPDQFLHAIRCRAVGWESKFAVGVRGRGSRTPPRR